MTRKTPSAISSSLFQSPVFSSPHLSINLMLNTKHSFLATLLWQQLDSPSLANIYTWLVYSFQGHSSSFESLQYNLWIHNMVCLLHWGIRFCINMAFVFPHPCCLYWNTKKKYRMHTKSKIMIETWSIGEKQSKSWFLSKVWGLYTAICCYSFVFVIKKHYCVCFYIYYSHLPKMNLSQKTAQEMCF